MILEKLLHHQFWFPVSLQRLIGGDGAHQDVNRLDQLYVELCEHILQAPYSSRRRERQRRRRQQQQRSSSVSSSNYDDDDDDTTELPRREHRRSSLSPRHRRRLLQGKKKLLLCHDVGGSGGGDVVAAPPPPSAMAEKNDETAASTAAAAAAVAASCDTPPTATNSQQQQHADAVKDSNNKSNNNTHQHQNQQHHHNMMVMQTAFRALAATRSADKEDTGSAVAVVLRDEEVANAMTLATCWEEAVVEVLQQMQQVLTIPTKQKKILKSSSSSSNNNNNNNRTMPNRQTSRNGDSQHELRDDEVFEYFCEHDILGLWVEIVQAKPNNCVSNNVSNTHNNNNNNTFYGVVWSPRVKAQIFAILQHMIHHATDASTLHYLFSNNAISNLLNSMLPLSQWTEQALEIMLPPFCDLLQQLTLQLSAYPQHWMPLFLVQDDVVLVAAADAKENNNTTTSQKTTTTTASSFPLFSVTLATLCSTLAQSDSFLHATCLHLLVNLLQIMSDTVMQNNDNDTHNATTTLAAPTALIVPVSEQVTLAHHISHKLVQRYHKIANITTGPAVDAIRSTAVGTQLNLFRDDLFALNDLLLACCCSSDTTTRAGGAAAVAAAAAAAWNVRLCEVVLEKCIYVWLQDLVPGAATNRPILAGVGSCDNDVIPEREALANTSMVCLTYFVEHVAYEPLLRMMAVALWYPQSCKLWCGVDCDESNGENSEYGDEYKWTQALNSLVAQHEREEEKNEDVGANDNDKNLLENPYRQEIIKSIKGVYGEWRVCTAAILMNKTMEAFDQEDLWLLGVIRRPVNYNQKGISSTLLTADQALEQYFCGFKSEHLPSRTLRMALECSSSLAIQLAFMYTNEAYWKGSNSPVKVDDSTDSSAPAEALQESLETIKNTFFRNVMSYHDVFGVSDIFVTLIENVARALYRHEERSHTSEKSVRIFLMSLYDCSIYSDNPEVLVRKLRSLEGSDVENCRFQIRMALHFRATSRVVRRLCQPKQNNFGNSNADVGLAPHKIDPADELAQIFTSLQHSPEKGSEIDLSGRMIFSCSSTINLAEAPSTSRKKHHHQAKEVGRVRTLSWDMILRPSSMLTLVLDPTHMFVVKTTTTAATESKRGVILCSIPLLEVIAAATDGDTLHIAVQHDNVGGLIQNGNMTLCFPSSGTSLVVQQYLDRSRQVLRDELLAKIKCLFSC